MDWIISHREAIYYLSIYILFSGAVWALWRIKNWFQGKWNFIQQVHLDANRILKGHTTVSLQVEKLNEKVNNLTLQADSNKQHRDTQPPPLPTVEALDWSDDALKTVAKQ